MRRRHQQLNFENSLHFVTTVTRERGQWFLREDICIFILTVFEKYRSKHQVDCFGFVLMPDHLHALLIQTNVLSPVSNLMSDFKRETSKLTVIPDYSEKTLWRDRFDDVPVPGYKAGMARLDYMHNNPVRRGLVEQAESFAWSSARFYAGLVEKEIVTLVRP